MKTYQSKGEGIYAYIEMTEEDGTMRFVPIAEDNADYQAYLRWLENPDAEEGGTL